MSGTYGAFALIFIALHTMSSPRMCISKAGERCMSDKVAPGVLARQAIDGLLSGAMLKLEQ